MRIGFITCVQLGLHCLEAIDAIGGRFSVLVTLPDDSGQAKSGRIALDEFAARTGTPLWKVRNINDAECVDRLRELDLDWLMIIGWSQIARPPVLTAARLGTLGMHPTLLPQGRGRASIPWAILKGLSETGVTLFKLDDGVDSGPIAAQARIPVSATETATTLYAKVSQTHADLLAGVWAPLQLGHLEFHPQDHSKASYWPGRKPEDGRITADMTPADAERLVRAVTRPYPGAFFDVGGVRLRIWKVQVIDHAAKVASGFHASSATLGLAGGVLRLLDWERESL